MKRNIKNIKYVIVPVIMAILLIGGTAMADESGRKSQLNSFGAINIESSDGAILIDAADLNTLADEIDTLESVYKTTTLAALNQINTYMREDGSITHHSVENQLTLPSFNQLAQAINDSQSSSTGIADLSNDLYYKTTSGALITQSSGTKIPDNAEHIELAPATSDNLSAGKVAYVDGTLLLGTGADNQAYYDLGYRVGYADGYKDHVPSGASIRYIKHEHSGNSGKNPIPDDDVYYSTTNPSGCYVSTGHTHNQAGSSCSQISGSKRCTGALTKNPYTQPAWDDTTSKWETTSWAYCTECGRLGETTDGQYWCGQTVPYSYWNCNGDGEGTSGEVENTWKVSCGKSTSTIVGAEIIWDD